MKATFAVLVAATAAIVSAQGTLDIAQITNAPTPTATAPPQINEVDIAAVEASLSSVVTATTAIATAKPARFRVKREAEAEAEPYFRTYTSNNWQSKWCKAFWWKPACRKPKSSPKRPVVAPKPCPKPPVVAPSPDPKPPVVPEPNPKPPVTPAPQPPRTDRCQPQPLGSGPTVSPDTPEDFLANPAFRDAALNAATPNSYNLVFQNLQAAYSGYSYITYVNLPSYDTQACAAQCDASKTCSSFNIYFERNPTLLPSTDATNATANCPNPTSTTNIRCALWSSAIDSKGATNAGQFQEQFRVVIAGSNGYSKPDAPIDIPDYEPPTKCPNGGYGDKGKDWWLGDKFFPGPFNPAFCRSYAKIQTIKNREDAVAKGRNTYSPCNSFNAFEVWDSGIFLGTYCKLFTEALPVDWADYKSANTLGKLYELKNSWLYKLRVFDFGRL